MKKYPLFLSILSSSFLLAATPSQHSQTQSPDLSNLSLASTVLVNLTPIDDEDSESTQTQGCIDSQPSNNLTSQSSESQSESQSKK